MNMLSFILGVICGLLADVLVIAFQPDKAQTDRQTEIDYWKGQSVKYRAKYRQLRNEINGKRTQR